MVGGTFKFRAALAEDPVLDLANELGTFFHDRLVSGAVDVIGLKAALIQSVEELFGRERTSLGTKFFSDRNTDSGRG